MTNRVPKSQPEPAPESKPNLELVAEPVEEPAAAPAEVAAEPVAATMPGSEAKSSIDLVRMMVGKQALVMTVAADRYGVNGRLLYVDESLLVLQCEDHGNPLSYPTFLPWDNVIQVDFSDHP